jgi:hypothetical protein
MKAIVSKRQRTPLAAVVRGLCAGAAGTLAMTVYQVIVAKIRGAEPSTVPAEVGKRVIRGVFQRRFPEEQTGKLNQAMHWGYGTTWGAAYALTDGTVDQPIVPRGLAFGTFVWAASLAELPAMKLAPPVWEYPPAELALDASYHLIYGLTVAGVYAALPS